MQILNETYFLEITSAEHLKKGWEWTYHFRAAHVTCFNYRQQETDVSLISPY